MSGSSNLTVSQDKKNVKKSKAVKSTSSGSIKEGTALGTGETQQQHTVLNDIFKQCKRKNKIDLLYMVVTCIDIILRNNMEQGADYIEECTQGLEKLRSNMRCRNYLVLLNDVWLKLPKEAQDKIEEQLWSFLEFTYTIRQEEH